MKNRLIYSIGEAIMTEIAEIKNVSYPKNELEPQLLFIELYNGKVYEISMTEK